MKSKMRLRLDNPCSRLDWSEHNCKQKVKFCQSCSKNVHNFTHWSQEEIAAYVHHSNEPVCGRVLPTQLHGMRRPRQKKSWPRSPKILATFLFLKSALGATPTDKVAQTNKEHQQFSQLAFASKFVAKNNPSDSIKNRISGRLLQAETQEPIMHTRIAIEGTQTHIHTDSLGYFELILPNHFVQETFVIRVQASYGFEGPLVKTLYRKDLPIENLILEKQGVLIGEITVKRKKKWWQFWKKR